MAAIQPVVESAYGRSLALRIAQVRLLLAVANFLVIRLDDTVPLSNTIAAYAESYGAALVFLVYAAMTWVVVARHWLQLHRVQLTSPFLDIVFSSLLIVSTDGYRSPFNLWIVFAVLNSAFGPYRRLPLLTAGMGLIAHTLIAFVPQAQPFELSVFAVRTSYLFGFAAVVSTVGAYLTVQSRALAEIDEIGQRLNEARTVEEAVRLLLEASARVLGVGVDALRHDLDSAASSGPLAPAACWKLRAGGESLGMLVLTRPAPMSRHEEAVIRVLCGRTASTLLRIRLTDELLKTAAEAERLRLTDALHDTHLQTLAALDLRLEVLRQIAEAADDPLSEELAEVKAVVRRAAREARLTLATPSGDACAGPEDLRSLLVERWAGEVELDLAPDSRLSQDQWRAVEMLVKEGIHNARKHSRSSRLALRIAPRGEEAVDCVLECDGDGPPEPVRFGYGLSRLRDVVAEQGGELRLEPLREGGVRLAAVFRVQ